MRGAPTAAVRRRIARFDGCFFSEASATRRRSSNTCLRGKSGSARDAKLALRFGRRVLRRDFFVRVLIGNDVDGRGRLADQSEATLATLIARDGLEQIARIEIRPQNVGKMQLRVREPV